MEPLDFLAATQAWLTQPGPLLVSAGAVCSFPIPVRLEARVAHALFAYEGCSPGNPAGNGRPLAWMIIGATGGAPVLFCRSQAESVILPQGPGGGEEPFPAPEASSPEHQRARAELLGQYERLFKFAFSQSPTEDRREVARAYYRLFYALVPTRQLPFYKALSPDFFEWLDLMTGHSTSPAQGMTPPPVGGPYGQIITGLERLSDLFTQKIQNDEHKQRLFDSMHAELQQYKNNFIDTLTRPMEGDIIKLIDDIERSMELFRAREFTRDNYRRLFTLFEGVGTDLTDLLYRHGVEPYSQEGDDVDVGRQKVLATVPTDRPRLDKKIAERHAKGWEKNGRIIRPERVSVYLYESKSSSGSEREE